MAADTPTETPAETPGTPPVLTLAAAIEACGVSRATLQRRLKAGAIAGAERAPGGGWRIPVSGLIAAGLAPRQTPPEQRSSALADPGSELEQLRSELQRALTERDHALELAAVHRDQAETLQETLRQLARALPPAAADPGQTGAERRRWWRRRDHYTTDMVVKEQ
jgi:hypothetical protein